MLDNIQNNTLYFTVPGILQNALCMLFQELFPMVSGTEIHAIGQIKKRNKDTQRQKACTWTFVQMIFFFMSASKITFLSVSTQQSLIFIAWIKIQYTGTDIIDVCVHVLSLNRVHFFATPRTVAFQAPLPMEFSRQEYWRGLPYPPPGACCLAGWYYQQKAWHLTLGLEISKYPGDIKDALVPDGDVLFFPSFIFYFLQCPMSLLIRNMY